MSTVQVIVVSPLVWVLTATHKRCVETITATYHFFQGVRLLLDNGHLKAWAEKRDRDREFC